MEKRLVPEVRFGEFQGNYKNYIFKDIFNFSTGKNIKQNEASPEFETPCIRYGELYHMYREVAYKIVNSTNLDRSELHFSLGNEILLPSAGEEPLDIGSATALTIKNVAIGRTINILRPQKDNQYSQVYVSHYICEKLRKKISTLAKGSSISNVYNSDLKKLVIVMPSFPEQQKIASFLTSINSKIEKLEQKKEKLEEYKKGVMQKLFSQELRFQDKNGKDYPDWEVKKLGDLIFKVGPKNKKKLSLPVYSINNQVGFLPQADQFEGLDSENRGFDISMYKIIDEKTFAYNPARIDVGSIGYSYDLNQVLISSLYVCFKTKEALNDLYLLQYLNTHKFKKDILRYEEGGVRQYLFYENFSHIKIPLPSIEEQIRITNFLTKIDKKIEFVNVQLEKTKAFKKGLLQKMFV